MLLLTSYMQNHYPTYQESVTFSDYYFSGVVRDVASNSGGPDWDMVKSGAYTTIGGTVSTGFGLYGIATGVGAPAGIAAVSFGIPTIGFGVARIIDGFQRGNRKLPGGLGEGFDIGVGGDGSRGQMFDVFSSGMPNNVATGIIMGYGIYNSNIGQSIFSTVDYNSNYYTPLITPRDNTNIVLPIRKY